MQRSLLHPDLPDGFDYRPEFLTSDEEQALLAEMADIPFSKVEMRGAIARRRTAHYGYTYGYEARTGQPGPAIPAFLLPLRTRIAQWMGVRPETLAEALITEYPPGAPIGWHRDAPMFGEVAGISLGSACRMKFRPYVSPKDLGGREPAVARHARRSGPAKPPGVRRSTHELELAPRSAYLIRGNARKDFEHSIPPVEGTRYSITFRTVTPRHRSG